ncbi:MAG: hypothetical protein WCL00_11760 [Bacteroidota bacterium]
MNKRKYFLNISLLIVSISSLFSCKKETKNEPVPVIPVFTVNFSDNFINPQLNAIVFISDMQGKILADTLVNGNCKIDILPLEGKAIPTKFMVTVVTWEFYVHNFIVTLNTYYGISKSTWNFKGHRATSSTHSTVTLSNVPPHIGPVLFSNTGYSNLTFNTVSRVMNLFRSPDDLYVQIETSAGPRYQWFTGLRPGLDTIYNMSNPLIPQLKVISFPQSAAYYEAHVSGYQGTDTESPLNYLVGEILGDGNLADSVSVPYPAGK